MATFGQRFISLFWTSAGSAQHDSLVLLRLEDLWELAKRSDVDGDHRVSLVHPVEICAFLTWVSRGILLELRMVLFADVRIISYV